jgi:hypothetical protein
VRFSFQRADIEPTPAFPSNVIYRPVIPIWIGPKGGPLKPFLGLLDTGADDTALPLSEAGRLGVSLDRSHPIPFRGVGGPTFGYFGEVTMELRRSPKFYRWTIQVAFMPKPKDASPEELTLVYLGHSGFFRFFNAKFDYQRNRVKIHPNGLFVGQRR